jgi:hypothetical protein
MEGIPPEFVLELSKALLACKRTTPAEQTSWRVSMEDFK